MKRCKHFNITIRESGGAYTDHSRDDKGWHHHTDVGGPYRRSISVFCSDCLMTKDFGPNQRRWPKWLQRAWKEMLDYHMDSRNNYPAGKEL